jgi:S-(hydroxymethyl)glutathione dehydrogenase/alcohol dehydrogenase
MLAAGVCHTDLAAVRDARTVPVVLGHEGVGVVESVGPGGDNELVGTRVLLSWKTPCGRCRRCLKGAGHLCEATIGVAAPRVSLRGAPLAVMLDVGCFCTYAVVPEQALIAVPPGLPDAHAALVGCAVATGIGAAELTAKIEPGAFVGVWGVGGVGANIVVGAKLALAEVIVAVDPDCDRRAAARARGATVACAPEDAAAVVAEATGGHGVDTAFEVVGRPEVMSEALECLGVGGRLVLVGAAARDAQLLFEPRRFMSRQQAIIGCIYGSIRPRFDLERLLRLCADGTVPVADLIGRTVGLRDVPELFGRPTEGLRTVIAF